MQFENIVIVLMTIALAVFMFARRRVITGLQEENAALGARLHKMGQVAERQSREIDALLETAQAERRARQMATLGSQPASKAPPARVSPVSGASMARKQEEATRRDPVATSMWENASQQNAYVPAHQVEQSRPSPTELFHGGGGTFDGGGASGDYDSSAGSCDSSSSSSDSGSSSSSDSGCSSSGSD